MSLRSCSSAAQTFALFTVSSLNCTTPLLTCKKKLANVCTEKFTAFQQFQRSRLPTPFAIVTAPCVNVSMPIDFPAYSFPHCFAKLGKTTRCLLCLFYSLTYAYLEIHVAAPAELQTSLKLFLLLPELALHGELLLLLLFFTLTQTHTLLRSTNGFSEIDCSR